MNPYYTEDLENGNNRSYQRAYLLSGSETFPNERKILSEFKVNHT